MNNISKSLIVVFFSVLLSGVVAQSVDLGESASMQYRGEFGGTYWYYPLEGDYSFDKDPYKVTLDGKLDLTFQFHNWPLEMKVTPKFIYDIDDDSSLERKELAFYGKGRNRIFFEDLYLDLFQARFELRAGIQTFSWKTIEGYSWADFLNQVDQQIDLLDAQKIGELSARMRIVLPMETESTLELYYLPWFVPTNVEQTDSRAAFRPNPSFAVSNDRDHVTYGNKYAEGMPQGAIRFMSIWNDIDYSMFYFFGYNRGVMISPRGENLPSGQHYEPMHKTGLTFQGALDEWLIKGEFVYNHYHNTVYSLTQKKVAPYLGMTSGVEYTLYSPIIDNHDLGIIAEIIASTDWDKDPNDLDAFRPFNNHLFYGFRYTFNNPSDRSILIGAFSSLVAWENVATVEFDERVFNSFKLNLKAMILWGEAESTLKSIEHLTRLDAGLKYNF